MIKKVENVSRHSVRPFATQVGWTAGTLASTHDGTLANPSRRGNGRNGWSTKLIRGLVTEAATGFQPRWGRCREPTPITPHYAPFPTYKAAGAHRGARRDGGLVARSACAATGDGGDRLAGQRFTRALCGSTAGLPPRLEGDWIYRRPEFGDRISLGGGHERSSAGVGNRSGGSKRQPDRCPREHASRACGQSCDRHDSDRLFHRC